VIPDHRPGISSLAPRHFAVVPAAGCSTRMGVAKLALPLGELTILEHVIRGLQQGGVQDVVVVVGAHVPELAMLAERARAHVCALREATSEMRQTVEHGLHWLEDHLHPQPADAWFLAPADHPLIDPQLVRQLAQAHAADRSRSIIVPVHEGRRGHPALFAWHHVADIYNYPPGLGLNDFIRSHAPDTLEVPAPSPTVYTDINTPADYGHLKRSWPPGAKKTSFE
jgi:molybdenum cofactor cytidylyltransferase